MNTSRPDQIVRQTAGVIDRSARGRIVVRGADRKTFLHALLTNDITGLLPGSGCYAALLTPQGRMVADMHVFETGGRDPPRLPARREGHAAPEIRRVHLQRGRAARRSQRRVGMRRRVWAGGRPRRVTRSRIGRGCGTRGTGGRYRRTRAVRQRADRRFRRRRGRRPRGRVRPARVPDLRLDGADAGDRGRGARCRSRADRAGDGGAASDRSRRTGVPRGHDHRDDSARGGHRVAGDQLHEGLLPGSGSDRAHPRPRAWPRRPTAGRPGRVGNDRALSGRPRLVRRQGDRPRDQRRAVAVPGRASRPGLRAA